MRGISLNKSRNLVCMQIIPCPLYQQGIYTVQVDIIVYDVIGSECPLICKIILFTSIIGKMAGAEVPLDEIIDL